ncbi:hypothetical protein K503DRAFT_805964 [Rhizopogon vinicolor AM-OR11-026]|uniref:Uncharacterized protein n=1 Tax=Rhizopogon vinicolor AM-OR11-026 TaxID=1314800 RepID=A0A1B7MG49_9AGAM|nr:hypothetical protein K503DRAFT_805964 [Rhizopogon vinicolor AM-OR11-026]
MAASMFMNSNTLPIALMQNLVPGVHGLKWTPDDSKDAMLGRALTFAGAMASSADIPPTPISPRSPSLVAVPYECVGGSQYVNDDISISDGETLGDGPSRFHPLSHDGQTQGQPTSPSHHWQTQVYPTSPSYHRQTQGRARTLRKAALLSSISVTSACLEDDVANEADIAIEPSKQH